MGIASNLWQRLGGAPDPRSDREIQDDIEAEFAFHLEQRERNLVARGLSPEKAHAEAARRFGNMDKVRAECRRVQLGGRIMLQRITLLLLVVLLATVAWLSFQSVTSQRVAQAEIQALHSEVSQLMLALEKNPIGQPNQLNLGLGNFAPRILDFAGPSGPRMPKPGATEETTSLDTWLARFRENALSESHTSETALLLRQQCSQDRALEVLPAIWPKLGWEQKLCMIDVMTDGSSEPLARTAVHLGATDADARVAERAFLKLRELTLLRFDADHRADYLAWHEANKDIELYDIVEKSAPVLVKGLMGLGKWNETCALYSPLVLHPDARHSGIPRLPARSRRAGPDQALGARFRSESARGCRSVAGCRESRRGDGAHDRAANSRRPGTARSGPVACSLRSARDAGLHLEVGATARRTR